MRSVTRETGFVLIQFADGFKPFTFVETSHKSFSYFFFKP